MPIRLPDGPVIWGTPAYTALDHKSLLVNRMAGSAQTIGKLMLLLGAAMVGDSIVAAGCATQVVDRAVNFDPVATVVFDSYDVSDPAGRPLPIISEWLKKLGLQDYFGDVRLYDYANLRGGGSEREAYFRFQVAESLFEAAQDGKDPSPFPEGMRKLLYPAIGDEEMRTAQRLLIGRSLAWLREHNVPRYLVRIHTFDTTGLMVLAEQFRQKAQIPLFQALAERISLATGIAADQMVFDNLSLDECRSVKSYWLGDAGGGYFIEHIPLCIAFATGTAELPPIASRNLVPTMLPDTASVEATASSPVINLAAIVRPFLHKRLSNTGARIEPLQESPTYVEDIVRGLRGYVIAGGQQWEKLQISFTLTGDKPQQVVVAVDGLLANSIGGYPPDSQFTKNMEPAFSKALSDFARALATELGHFMTQEARR